MVEGRDAGGSDPQQCLSVRACRPPKVHQLQPFIAAELIATVWLAANGSSSVISRTLFIFPARVLVHTRYGPQIRQSSSSLSLGGIPQSAMTIYTTQNIASINDWLISFSIMTTLVRRQCSSFRC